MQIDIITCLPELLESPFNHSILKRAQQNGLIDIRIHNLRNFSNNKHKKIDDYAYGGGAGMVIKIEPVDRCLEYLKSTTDYDEIIYMSPDGESLSQPLANTLSLAKNIVILCGHYKGIDERIREHLITKEISIGDYVLSGGELPAAVLVDTVVRLIPDVLNNETSALTDSFQDGLIAPPVYTRPAKYKGMNVPDVLISGHEKNIEEWRINESIKRTNTRKQKNLNQ